MGMMLPGIAVCTPYTHSMLSNRSLRAFERAWFRSGIFSLIGVELTVMKHLNTCVHLSLDDEKGSDLSSRLDWSVQEDQSLHEASVKQIRKYAFFP